LGSGESPTKPNGTTDVTDDGTERKIYHIGNQKKSGGGNE